MPAAKNLSYLPYRAKRYLPPHRYEHIMADLSAMVAEAQRTLEADRSAFAKLESELPVAHTVELIFGAPQHRRVRCYHPLSRDLVQMLADMIELDKQWCVYAWNVEQAREFLQESSPYLDYLLKQEEWVDRLRQLRSRIKACLNTLSDVSQPKPASGEPAPLTSEEHHV